MTQQGQLGQLIYRDDCEKGEIRRIRFTRLEDSGDGFLRIFRPDGLLIELRKSLVLKIEHIRPENTEAAEVPE